MIKVKGTTMFLIPKQIKSYIYLMVACCSAMYLTKAMEQQTPEMEKKAEEEQVSFLANVPKEIKTHIISFLESAKDVYEAVRNIKALSLTSKYFHNLISNPKVLGSLIEAISKRFDISPTHVAIEFNNPNAVHWLKSYIQQQPPSQRQELVNKVDNGGYTPLHQATFKGNKDIVELLLDAGADTNTQAGKNLYTPLLLAACHDKNDIAELLVKARADVNRANRDDTTPLHCAARNGNKDLVKLLLDAGADVNVQDIYGDTPLDSAVSNGHEEIVKLLREHGALSRTELNLPSDSDSDNDFDGTFRW
jgi:hypothetical protein